MDTGNNAIITLCPRSHRLFERCLNSRQRAQAATLPHALRARHLQIAAEIPTMIRSCGAV